MLRHARTHLPRLLAVAAALAVAGTGTQAVLTPTRGSAAASAADHGSRVALTWSPTYMSNDHHYTRGQAVALARRVDLVAAMPVAFQHHVRAMRAANPQLRVLAYANATLADPSTVRGLPEQAFAHDAHGHRIKANGWGTYLMEPSSSAWQRAANRECDDRAHAGRYDGCLVDMLTLGIYSKGFVSGLPVVPGTHRVYSQAEYRQRLETLGASYQRLSPSLMHVDNSVENGYRYWRASVASRPLVSGLKGAQMEDFLRGAYDGATAVPGGSDWRRDLRVVQDLESKHITGLFTTKLWSGATRSQAARWDAYAMSTFLLGANGHSYFAFTRSRDKAGATGANAPYRMPKGIGAPTSGAHRLGSGAFERSFQRGLAVVNPSGHATTVRLGGTYRALGGHRTSVLHLGPRTGDVLVRS
jgi:hypothetical protein